MKKDVELFFEKISKNENLKNSIKRIRNKYESKNLEGENLKKFINKELIPFARNNGFKFNF